MFSGADNRWHNRPPEFLIRIQFDPRPQLLKLQSNNDSKTAWRELWEGLHHQGDVGDASPYAAVPHLVRIYRERGVIDWNTYAIVAVIELARDSQNNPEVPLWLKEDYFQAIRGLAEAGAVEILHARGPGGNSSNTQLPIAYRCRGADTRKISPELLRRKNC